VAENSGISWTDHTFNPWLGCVKVSEGCRHCYAEAYVTGRMGKDVWGPPETTQRHITKTPWAQVKKFQRAAAAGAVGVMGEGGPILVFCASLADIFESHPQLIEHRARVWKLIAECPDLHFLLLTKRPENIAGMLPKDWGDGYPNVWLGTTVENLDVSWRIEVLAAIPARVRFISYEPAIGPLAGVKLDGIHWMIYGGESGKGFRPDQKMWAREMREQCRREKIAFFYKQACGLKSKTDPVLDGQTVHGFPSLEEIRHADK
jgi:protein gp37